MKGSDHAQAREAAFRQLGLQQHGQTRAPAEVQEAADEVFNRVRCDLRRRRKLENHASCPRGESRKAEAPHPARGVMDDDAGGGPRFDHHEMIDFFSFANARWRVISVDRTVMAPIAPRETRGSGRRQCRTIPEGSLPWLKSGSGGASSQDRCRGRERPRSWRRTQARILTDACKEKPADKPVQRSICGFCRSRWRSPPE